ncbi:MAG: ATP phosphoribosyltransferase regulatory subunit [Hyphomicrobiaceae bacterium]
MTAETVRAFQVLEAQAQSLMAVFAAAYYESVAPAIIQPADLFLDVIGEALRTRTYVFTDLDGTEQCLRPDLTVPLCRLYLERHPRADMAARYSSNGPVFRFQPAGASAAHPREAHHADIEYFGGSNKEAADVEVVRLVLAALRQAGLADFHLRTGDIGLFDALLRALALPERWFHRLHAGFWRPGAFRAELKRLTQPAAAALEGVPPELIPSLDLENPAGAEQAVAEYLDANAIEPMGERTIAEIAAGLCAAVADARAEPLSPTVAAVCEEYFDISAAAPAAGDRIDALMRRHRIDITSALAAYRRRLRLLGEAGIDPAAMDFSAGFGRNFEYYTGFVFEVTAPQLALLSPVAGGGRYDRLLGTIGAPHDVPAVGAMIHTERLLSVVRGRAA